MSDESSGVILRPESGLPAYRQVVDQLRFLITAGRYARGVYLPPMRVLSEELGLNLNTVNRAYRQLQRDGLIRSTQGRGALVIASEASDRSSTAGADRASNVDAILSAAVERALASGLSPKQLEERIGALVRTVASRLPALAPIWVAAGPERRSVRLAERLTTAVGREAAAVDARAFDDDRPSIIVRARFGAWTADVEPRSTDVLVDAAVVLDRDATKRLFEIEPGSAVRVVAYDEAAARWLAELVSVASPSSVRWIGADGLEGLDTCNGEVSVVEAGLADENHVDAIDVAFAFPGTISGDIGDAAERLVALNTNGSKS